jgi:uncharacterized protein (DUF2252 family)
MKPRNLGWTPQPNRTHALAILAAQNANRLPELIPLRAERMRASPFAFFRGSAAIMAADLATLPHPGPTVQLSGDAHLANFGAYASPEGNPVFDLNDFDETLPGPFDWDLRRLATSLILSAREHALPPKECRALATRAARHYRRHLERLAKLPPIDAWHSTIDLRAAIQAIDQPKLRRRLEKRLRAAPDASIDHYNLVDTSGAHPRIAEQENTRHLPTYTATITAAFAAYPQTLQPQYQDLLARYRLTDSAFKVVGIGSVGTFCAIGLFLSEAGAPLLLQLKEAQTSVLSAPTNAPPRAAEGERVVTGQRRLQAQSDIFLGWTPLPIDNRDFYVRRLKDSRLSNIGTAIEADALPFTAALCGRTLARAHGRAGDAARLHPATDVDHFEDMIADFAVAYADQAELDYEAFKNVLF